MVREHLAIGLRLGLHTAGFLVQWLEIGTWNPIKGY
jgi:hypothetical protein